MARPYKPTIPETLGELADQLGWMMLRSPRFEHEEFPGLDLEMVFVELGEGLNRLRRKLGEETFEALREMSGQMRACFEADPADVGEEALRGRMILQQMQKLLADRRKSGRMPANDS